MKFLVLTVLYLPLISTGPVMENFDPHIVGGQDARAGQFPFAVAIRINTTDSSIFCGGAVISTQWVLTAAHCIMNAKEIEMTLGSIQLSQPNSHTLVLSSTTYFMHPAFDSVTLENDIGLIEFREAIQYSDYIGKIHLPVTEYGSDVHVTAIGWGQSSDEVAEYEDHLKCVQMTTISNSDCKIVYNGQILDDMVCAVGQFSEGICTGDSGSPLVYYLNYIHPVIVGVASFYSSRGCESVDPSGYTRVYPYRDWILNITGPII